MAVCHAMGVDFTGFIFARSPRAVDPRHVSGMPTGAALRVGVFAGMDVDDVCETARLARLDIIQLHGGEEVAFCRAVGPERVIKVLWPERLTPQILAMELERFAPVCAYFLLDAGHGGGGSGRNLPWEALSGIKPPKPWLLAGGLGPDNLALALATCKPGGVDLNSALESAPGVKDHNRLRQAVVLAKTCTPEKRS